MRKLIGKYMSSMNWLALVLFTATMTAVASNRPSRRSRDNRSPARPPPIWRRQPPWIRSSTAWSAREGLDQVPVAGALPWSRPISRT